MNDNSIEHDQTDEDILTYEISDEALEAAAGTGARVATTFDVILRPFCV